MDTDEKKKMKALLREREKGDAPMDWMYKQSKPDAEDYLLGKKIDKLGEDDDKVKEEDSVGAIFNERIQANINLDMHAKMREDPLFAIRRKEEEAKTRLLKNPVKMKQLQQAIARKEKASHGSKKKKRKHKKSESEDDDDDDDLVSKYLNILNAKHKGSSNSSKTQKDRGRPNDDVKRPHDSSRDRQNDDKWHKDNSRGRPNDERIQGNRNATDRHRNYGEHHNYSRGRSNDSQNSLHKRDGKRGYEDKNKYEHESRKEANNRNSHDVKKKRQYSSSSDSDDLSYHSKHKYTQKEPASHSSDDESRNRPNNKGRYRRRSNSSSSSENVKGKQSNKGKTHRKGNVDAESDYEKQRTKSKKGRNQRCSNSSESEEDIKPEENPHKSRYNSDEEERRVEPKSYGLIVRPGTEPVRRVKPEKKSERSPDVKGIKSRSQGSSRRQSPSPPQRKLTAEEKKRRLAEMMENADWREEQRRGNVKRYAEEDQREEERQKDNYKTTNSSDFVNPMMAKHASQSSVEDRIKRNRHNILRTTADMDRGFSKK